METLLFGFQIKWYSLHCLKIRCINIMNPGQAWCHIFIILALRMVILMTNFYGLFIFHKSSISIHQKEHSPVDAVLISTHKIKYLHIYPHYRQKRKMNKAHCLNKFLTFKVIKYIPTSSLKEKGIILIGNPW